MRYTLRMKEPRESVYEKKFTAPWRLSFLGSALVAGAVVLLLVLAYIHWPQQVLPTVMLKHFFSESPTSPSPPVSGVTGNSQSVERVFENGHYVTIVRYDGFQFTPHTVTIANGESVRFVNESNLAMRVGSRPESLSSTYYSSLTQPYAEGSGSTFEVQLQLPGIWSYENLSDESSSPGVVYVR